MSKIDLENKTSFSLQVVFLVDSRVDSTVKSLSCCTARLQI